MIDLDLRFIEHFNIVIKTEFYPYTIYKYHL